MLAFDHINIYTLFEIPFPIGRTVDVRSTGSNASPIFSTKDVRRGYPDTPSEAQVKRLKPISEVPSFRN